MTNRKKKKRPEVVQTLGDRRLNEINRKKKTRKQHMRKVREKRGVKL